MDRKNNSNDSGSSKIMKALDETGQKKFHLKVWLTSGMGFFTDAYDLWIIGVALLFIIPEFHPSALMIGLLTSSSLFGAVLGPLIFGSLGDIFGRKYVYGIEILILALGAVLSALATSFLFLIVARLILGVGVGGDYPTSATIMSEYSNRKNRGRLVSMVFATQGFGILTGIGVAFGLIALHVSPGIIWRVMLGFGAIPALSVFYFRRTLDETPRYNAMVGKVDEAKTTVQKITGISLSVEKEEKRMIGAFAALKKYALLLVGTAGAWFLFDISYYGTGIFTPLLVQTFGFSGTYASIQASALIFALAAVPGYWVAVALIDKEGRKPMQAIGFAAMAVLFVVLYLIGGPLRAISPLFIIFYALTFFFSNFGPNTTTFIYPTEVFPTKIRNTSHGISAAAGKLGAAISTLFFPLLLVYWGKYDMMLFLGGVALAGVLLTVFLLPETKLKSLEVSSREESMMYKGLPNSSNA